MFSRARDIAEQCRASHRRDRAEAELRRLGTRQAASGLTATEQRVAELASLGHTNSEIASELFISRRTVESDLARAYRKLRVRSRAQLSPAPATLAAETASPDTNGPAKRPDDEGPR